MLVWLQFLRRIRNPAINGIESVISDFDRPS
jgi:hypothetical protein